MLKRLLTVVLASAAILVVLEVVLQVLSMAVWLTRQPAQGGESDAAGTQTVLCLGDSYTFGMGASHAKRSYPGRLEDKLRRRLGSEWSVVNRAWPSRNSRELLEDLDASLAAYEPRFVCLLVGLNDSWSRPEELMLPAADGVPRRQQDRRFLWRLRTWRLLTIVVSGLPAEAADDPNTHLGRLRTCLAGGDSDGALLELEWLREAHLQHPTRWVAESLAEGLQASGLEDEALALARDQLTLYPDSSRLWVVVARQAARIGDISAARTAIDAALESSPTRPGVRAFLWRTRAGFYRETDPGVVAESLILAFLDDGDEAQGRQWFQVHRNGLDEGLLVERCVALGLSSTEQSQVLEIYRQAAAGTGLEGAKAILASHLRQAVERCRRRGAEPLLGSYPWSGAFGEHTAREVAVDLGVGWVPVHEVFSATLQEDPGVQLFVHDGHCNDAGYDLMAEVFAREIVRRAEEKLVE